MHKRAWETQVEQVCLESQEEVYEPDFGACVDSFNSISHPHL